MKQENMFPKNFLFSQATVFFALVGILCLVCAGLFFKNDHEAFFLSFHVSWLFFISIAFGSVFFVLIQFATKAGWSVVIRRIAENLSLTIIVLSIFIVVMFLGSHSIYHHWLSQESFSDSILNSKRWYLNTPFFFSRSVFYLVVFIIAALVFSRLSLKQDKCHEHAHAITYRSQKLSIPFLIVCGFSITYASIDWIMSTNPHWYSTIFGLYYFAGCYLTAICFISVIAYILRSKYVSKELINLEHFYDFGKLVFGHSCFWAYAAFVQYLLIWYGNIPEETMWYAVRQNEGWWPIWCLLCVGHFIVPFLFLMARKAKRSPRMVLVISLWMMFMHYIDLYWLIIPNFHSTGPQFSILDVLTFLGLFGIFFSFFLYVSKGKATFPLHDPRLKESLTYESV